MSDNIKFSIKNKISGSLGRAGVLYTKNGEIKTPAFMAVGTKATVKSLSPEEVKGALSQAVLANTYHLYLEPGEEIIKNSGGLGKFMNWSGPTFTDSGGFQAFSLGVAFGSKLNKFTSGEAPIKEELEEALKDSKEKKAKITEDGVEFKSVIDGSKHFFSPEKSIQIQSDLGADIIFALDEFTSPHADFDRVKLSNERTHRWAERCLVEFNKNRRHQGLFGIVQGGRSEELRKESARVIGSMDFDGFGIGGTFEKADMGTAVKWVNSILPEDKPRHLLGIGEPIDIINGVENGCDTFDCVAPTRMARNGSLYTRKGRINILNAKYRSNLGKVEEGCGCYLCTNYTLAYLSHLFRAKEMSAATLASIHNLYFLNKLCADIRQAILDNKFHKFKEEFIRNYTS